ncbi:MAG: ATP-binding protein [Candidatus Bathyarchaeota archaeon]|nr:ATP-binding protein [Candidatus Bathyarchaeota archaeon]
MNLYAILSLFASTISITLGISVFFLNRTAKLNRLFMVMMIFNSYWAFCLFMMSQSTSLAGALFWQKVLFLWPFIMSLLLHFTLAYTESNLLKNKFIYVALYFPALFFSLTDLTNPNVISTTPILKFWGYQNTLPNNSLLCWLDNIWACSFAVLSVVFFVRYHNSLKEKTRKQQAKIVAVAFTIPIILALITDSLFPFAGIDFPGLGAISCSITTFFVAYGMLKYELFSFRPEIATENIFATMSDSVILLTLDGKIMKVNQAFKDLTGYSEKEVIGKTINELLRMANVLNQENNPAKIIENLRSIREIKNYELSFTTKTGEKRIVTVSCSVVSDNGGKDVGVAFVLRDFTERRAIEQKLLKAERFASIGELAGMLGHDLRNPLSGISGANFYLQRKLKGKLDTQEKAMFESIDKSIDYSNKIINDLLDYASCCSDEVKLELSQVTPKSLVKVAQTLSVQPKNIKLLDETADSPQFYVDEVKICRSFINILKNAFDAMPNGGEVRVTSEVKADKVTFTFKDSGCGMTKETIEKLWTPLFTTKAKGMGFGMIICKRNITAHGGKIDVESVLGKGTTITVKLPLNLKS